MDGVDYTVQNANMAFCRLQPDYWLYDMPAKFLTVNGQNCLAKGIQRKKKQELTYPVGNDDPDPKEAVKTNLGEGEISKISINLQSRTAKTTLNYDTEQQ